MKEEKSNSTRLIKDWKLIQLEQFLVKQDNRHLS